MSVVNPIRQSGRQIGQFSYDFAQHQSDIEDSLRLRHRVFVQEMGARTQVTGRQKDLEQDALDPYCLHLIVRDVTTDHAVASTRILTHDAAIAAGGFYSAHEFDLADVLACPGRFMEIGRTCVDPDYRDGGAINALWAGVAELVRSDDYDHLIGCASVDLRGGLSLTHAICNQAMSRGLAPVGQRVQPHVALPAAAIPGQYPEHLRLPPLLKAYLRLGAYVGGEPCWDPYFHVADLFMHLDLAALSPRYARHFLGRPYASPRTSGGRAQVIALR